MAAFDTSLVITTDTTIEPDDGRVTAIAEGGQIRGRNAYDETVFRIRVVIKGDVTVKQSLESFYATNKDSFNTITIDDSNYSALFTSRPRVTAAAGDIRFIEFGLLAYEV